MKSTLLIATATFLLIAASSTACRAASFGEGQSGTTALTDKDTAPASIQQLEQRLFFKNYSDDELTSRVSRIEKQVFGEPVKSALNARIAKLDEVLRQQKAGEKQHSTEAAHSYSQAQPSAIRPSVTSSSGAGGLAASSGVAPSPSYTEDSESRLRLSARAAREEEIGSLLGDGVNLYRQKQGALALDKFAQVLRLDPNNPQAHFNVGIVQESQGNYVEALSHYQRAAALDQGNSEYSQAVTAIQAKAGAQSQALLQRSQLKNLAENANLAWKRGDYPAALRLYLELDSREPNRPLVKYNVGSIYMMMKERTTALSYYKQAFALDPSNPKYVQAYSELGYALSTEQAPQGGRTYPASNVNVAQGGGIYPANNAARGGATYAPNGMIQGGGAYSANNMAQGGGMYTPNNMAQGYTANNMMAAQTSVMQPAQGAMVLQASGTPAQRQNSSNYSPPKAKKHKKPASSNSSTIASASPFAGVMAPANFADQEQSSRASYGVTPNAAARLGFKNTSSSVVPITKGSLVTMSSFGIAGKKHQQGVVVTNVGIGSRAQSAGLQPGDDIRAVDGSEVKTPTEIEQALSQANNNDKIKIVIIRNGSLAVLNL